MSSASYHLGDFFDSPSLMREVWFAWIIISSSAPLFLSGDRLEVFAQVGNQVSA